MGSPEVLVIGGGAAGIIAAWRAASLGAAVLLVERNPRLGLKLRISGGGKCNITHAGSMRDIRRAFRPNEAEFLGPAFARFTNSDVLHLVTSRGVEVYTRPDGRVFPVDGRADDVVAAFAEHLRRSGAETALGCPVLGIERDGPGYRVSTDRGQIAVPRLIVAVGGSSYPRTGTTGDGFRWMRELGHTVHPLRPALAPLYLEEGCRPEYAGLALRDVAVRVRAGSPEGKEIERWRGDLLFTHRGVSGPAALAVSRRAAEALEAGPVYLEADLAPDSSFEQLAAELVQGHGEGGRRGVRRWVESRVPERLVPEVMTAAGVDPGTPLHRLGKKERSGLVGRLKAWSLGRVRGIPLEKGEVTAGGVALDEVDPATMESRILPGLFLCGEILDIAGPVGGYNLQAAFSTGFVAGESASVGPARTRELQATESEGILGDVG